MDGFYGWMDEQLDVMDGLMDVVDGCDGWMDVCALRKRLSVVCEDSLLVSWDGVQA